VAVEAGQEQGGEAVLLLHVDQVAENEWEEGSMLWTLFSAIFTNFLRLYLRFS
jgi:hypothetical protein